MNRGETLPRTQLAGRRATTQLPVQLAGLTIGSTVPGRQAAWRRSTDSNVWEEKGRILSPPALRGLLRLNGLAAHRLAKAWQRRRISITSPSPKQPFDASPYLNRRGDNKTTTSWRRAAYHLLPAACCQRCCRYFANDDCKSRNICLLPHCLATFYSSAHSFSLRRYRHPLAYLTADTRRTCPALPADTSLASPYVLYHHLSLVGRTLISTHSPANGRTHCLSLDVDVWNALHRMKEGGTRAAPLSPHYRLRTPRAHARTHVHAQLPDPHCAYRRCTATAYSRLFSNIAGSPVSSDATMSSRCLSRYLYSTNDASIQLSHLKTFPCNLALWMPWLLTRPWQHVKQPRHAAAASSTPPLPSPAAYL